MPLSYCTACYTTQTAKGDSNGDMRSMLSEYPKWNHKKHHRRRACNPEDETWRSSPHRKGVGELAGTEIDQYGVAMRAFGPRRSCIARVRNSLEGSLSLSEDTQTYRDKYPNPANAKLLWPLGKLLHPSSRMWLLSWVQTVYPTNTSLGVSFVGLQREIKSGRGIPTAFLITSVTKVVNNIAARKPRIVACVL